MRQSLGQPHEQRVASQPRANSQRQRDSADSLAAIYQRDTAHYQAYAAQEPVQQGGEKPPVTDWIMAVATVVLVVVTGALALYTYRLWRETGRLAREAREAAAASLAHAEATARRQLCAYIGVRTHRPKKGSSENGPPFPAEYVTRFRNFGQTPGYDVEIEYAIRVAQEETPEAEIAFGVDDISSDPAARHTLGAGAQISAHWPTIPPAMPSHMKRAIEEGSLRVYVFGHVTYRDVFGDRHETHFRLIRPPGDRDFGPCADGNEAD